MHEAELRQKEEEECLRLEQEARLNVCSLIFALNHCFKKLEKERAVDAARLAQLAVCVSHSRCLTVKVEEEQRRQQSALRQKEHEEKSSVVIQSFIRGWLGLFFQVLRSSDVRANPFQENTFRAKRTSTFET